MPLDVLGCTRATLKCTTSNGNARVVASGRTIVVRQKHHDTFQGTAFSSLPNAKALGNHCNTLRDRDRAL